MSENSVTKVSVVVYCDDDPVNLFTDFFITQETIGDQTARLVGQGLLWGSGWALEAEEDWAICSDNKIISAGGNWRQHLGETLDNFAMGRAVIQACSEFDKEKSLS